MVEVCEGAQVAVSGWVPTDRHDLGSCAANSLVCHGMVEVCIGRYGMQWYGFSTLRDDVKSKLLYFNRTWGESRVAGGSRKSCALGCGRALLWNALPVARRALGARWKDPTPELDKKSITK